MKKLSNTWLIEGHIDLEYQQYVLLDYLQFIKNYYKDFKLYPCFSDLIELHRSLNDFKNKKDNSFNAFPKMLKGIDWDNQKLIYKDKEEDDDILKTINNIVDFSIPLIENHVELGKAIYQAINNDLKLEPIGIQPLYKKEGYILLELDGMIKIYQFKVTPLSINEESFIGVHFDFKTSHEVNLSTTNEKLKMKLVKKNNELPNPAAYFVKIKKDFIQVLDETILPILKRKIMTLS